MIQRWSTRPWFPVLFTECLIPSFNKVSFPCHRILSIQLVSHLKTTPLNRQVSVVCATGTGNAPPGMSTPISPIASESCLGSREAPFPNQRYNWPFSSPSLSPFRCLAGTQGPTSGFGSRILPKTLPRSSGSYGLGTQTDQ